jgi:hypothetical protein
MHAATNADAARRSGVVVAPWNTGGTRARNAVMLQRLVEELAGQKK